jgi:hypothetical protein
MELRLVRDGLPFQHLLDQVNASARTVELVSEELVRRTRGRAKAAVHAVAQDRFCFATFGRVLDEWGEMGLHQKSG